MSNTPPNPLPSQQEGELKLTDFTEQELQIAEALGVRNKLPVDKNLFDGGCLCHTYPKDSDRACGNHAEMLGQIRKVEALIAASNQAAAKKALELAGDRLYDLKEVDWGVPTKWSVHKDHADLWVPIKAVDEMLTYLAHLQTPPDGKEQ